MPQDFLSDSPKQLKGYLKIELRRNSTTLRFNFVEASLSGSLPYSANPACFSSSPSRIAHSGQSPPAQASCQRCSSPTIFCNLPICASSSAICYAVRAFTSRLLRCGLSRNAKSPLICASEKPTSRAWRIKLNRAKSAAE